MNATNLANAFWGVPSSKANFCEEDYVVTRYIAEFINSLTNLAYIFYAIYGLYRLRQKSNHDFFRALPYWGLMAVGICSAIFHVSLQYHTQMRTTQFLSSKMDDLSMLFTTTPVLHQVLTVNATRQDSMKTAGALYLALAVFIVYHTATDELLVHSIMFVASVAVIGVRTFQLVQLRTPKHSAIRCRIWGMVRFGAFIFHLGYLVWLVDGWACDWLRRTRTTVGLPWALALELHGWWHVFTGIGAYTFIAVIDHLVSGTDHKDIDRSFAWPTLWAAQSVFAMGISAGDQESGKRSE